MTTDHTTASRRFWERFDAAAKEWAEAHPEVATAATNHGLTVKNQGGGCQGLERTDDDWRTLLTHEEGELPDTMKDTSILGFYRIQPDQTEDWSVCFIGPTERLLENRETFATRARAMHAEGQPSEQTDHSLDA